MIPSWFCMKGHTICTKCCKRTSPCPTCALFMVECVICQNLVNDISQHLSLNHSYSGPFSMHSSFFVEIEANSENFKLSNVYKRITNEEEKIYTFDLEIKDETLLANIFCLNNLSESVKYSISGKKNDKIILYYSKTGHEGFVACIKQIKRHFTYLNVDSYEVFKVEVDFCNENFFI